MFFFLIICLAFVCGILAGIPTAPFFSPKSATAVIIVTIPFITLSLLSANPIISDIRYYYLAFAMGIFTYWTYSQIKLQ